MNKRLDIDLETLQSLEIKNIYRAFISEQAPFLILVFYIMVEYLRPQNSYPMLNILPWGLVALLTCLASIFISKSGGGRVNRLDFLVIIFSIIVLVSGFTAWNPARSMQFWTTYTSWVLMYFCIVSIINTPKRILLFTIMFLIINFKMSQHGAVSFTLRGFSFAHWGIIGAGLFRNSGEFAMQMVVIFSMSFSLLIGLKGFIGRKRWLLYFLLLPGTTILTVIASSSRGGQIALLTVLIICFLKGGKFFKKVFFSAILIVVASQIIPDEQFGRFSTMGDDETSMKRIEHWEKAIETIRQHPMSGVGYKNWAVYYHDIYNPILAEEVHNTILEAFVDLGYPGGGTLILLLFFSFVMNYQTKKMINMTKGQSKYVIASVAEGVNLGLLGALVASFFMSVLYYPVFWFAFAMTSVLYSQSTKKYNEYLRGQYIYNSKE